LPKKILFSLCLRKKCTQKIIILVPKAISSSLKNITSNAAIAVKAGASIALTATIKKPGRLKKIQIKKKTLSFSNVIANKVRKFLVTRLQFLFLSTQNMNMQTFLQMVF